MDEHLRHSMFHSLDECYVTCNHVTCNQVSGLLFYQTVIDICMYAIGSATYNTHVFCLHIDICVCVFLVCALVSDMVP